RLLLAGSSDEGKEREESDDARQRFPRGGSPTATPAALLGDIRMPSTPWEINLHQSLLGPKDLRLNGVTSIVEGRWIKLGIRAKKNLTSRRPFVTDLCEPL